MELLIIGLIVLAIYLAIRSVASLGSWFGGGGYRAYRQLAARFGGRYESRGFYEPPTVSFLHRGAQVRVGLAPHVEGQASLPRTRVVVRFPRGIPFRLELAPAARPSPPQPPKGTRFVTLGIPRFDQDFVVQANDAEMACDFLSTDVIRSLLTLQSMVHPGGMLVSINPERLLVQIDRNLGLHAESLIAAVSQALLIQDGLQAGVARRLSAGIEIVSREDSGTGSGDRGETLDSDVGPPICKVCGEAIESTEILVCASCYTPHHQDCWQYVGACSIYGCNGKQTLPH
jgi:hypothetical protein